MLEPDAHWTLDPRLAADTLWLCDLPLCRLVRRNDARFPWLILIPRRAGAREIHLLTAADQQALWAETTACAQQLAAATQPEKMNVGALGNIVAQLHMHVVARRRDDAAWPGPVWGHGQPSPYAADPPWQAELIANLQNRYGADQ